MNRGEKLTDKEIYGSGKVYVIWPRGDKWDLRFKRSQEWEVIHDGLFDTENAAFLFAHQHLVDSDRPTQYIIRTELE